MASNMRPSDIEAESFSCITRELRERVHDFPPDEFAVVRRVIHASADFSFADSLFFTCDAIRAGVSALRAGATILTDTNMARAGINEGLLAALGCTVCCYMADADVAARAKERDCTRAQVSMEKACGISGPLIVAIGNAPTALLRLLELVEQDAITPALVVGVPVGFVHVVEAKEQLIASELPAIVSRGRKGGSTIAAAIINALMRLALQEETCANRISADEAKETVSDKPAGVVLTAEVGKAASDTAAGDVVVGAAGDAGNTPQPPLAVFAGTTEGRMLCERLSAAGLCADVYVATDYGELFLLSLPHISVHTGRLNADEMTPALKGVQFVVDATHPFAREAHTNIAAAAKRSGARLLRLRREATQLPNDALVFPSAAAVVKYLSTQEGNALLTVGSKALAEFVAIPDYAARLYVRILPDPEAIRACRALGFSPSHIIAMQGTFSRELNEALLRECDARWLVTKDSGTFGGLDEKLDAARCVRATPLVIARPPEVGETFSLDEVCMLLGAGTPV